jgi:hypothetical protein
MYALTPYGYATVALAAREPEWDPQYEDPDGLLDDADEQSAEDRDAPSLDEAYGAAAETYCPDWPHRYPCDVCGGGGCRTCSGTGEREDRSPCRH